MKDIIIRHKARMKPKIDKLLQDWNNFPECLENDNLLFEELEEFKKKLNEEIEIFNQAMELKIKRLENLKIK